MKLAKEQAACGVAAGEGGPFGAVIIDKMGNIIAVANNQVLLEKDPTAHAEVQAIRKACQKLDTYDLSDCILYTSCEPCPMCLSAIIWANIKEVYYGCDKKDAGHIGFRDDMIYDFLEGKRDDVLKEQQIDREECIKLFEQYQADKGTIY